MLHGQLLSLSEEEKVDEILRLREALAAALKPVTVDEVPEKAPVSFLESSTSMDESLLDKAPSLKAIDFQLVAPKVPEPEAVRASAWPVIAGVDRGVQCDILSLPEAAVVPERDGAAASGKTRLETSLLDKVRRLCLGTL